MMIWVVFGSFDYGSDDMLSAWTNEAAAREELSRLAGKTTYDSLGLEAIEVDKKFTLPD